MMIDWGIGPLAQEDILDINAPYVDLAKIAVGIPRLIPDDLLMAKNYIYRRHGVEPFPGGMLLELVMHQYRKAGKSMLDAARRYYEESQRVGFRVMEVSDNVIEISPSEKHQVIEMAAKEFGFRVLGEVGTKREVTTPEEMSTDIENCLDAGSWKVLLEAAEFVDKHDGSIKLDLIEAVTKRTEPQLLIFEIPGSWNSNTSLSRSHDMAAHLVHTLGPDVNLGNILPKDIIELETLRLNIGVGMQIE